MLNDLRSDVWLAARSLRRRPAFAAVACLTLGLGIGANVAVFSVVDAVLLRALPYSEPERLVTLWGELPGQGLMDSHLTGPELAAIWEGSRTLQSMGAVWSRPGVLRADGDAAEELEVGWVTPGFLETLGARTQLGRLPTREELVADPTTVILLSHELWQRRFGSDPAIVGRAIDFDDERRTVVGVLPRGFRLYLPPDQGVPETLAAFLPWGGSDYRTLPRSFRVFSPVARLAPGATPARAAAELAGIAERVKSEDAAYGRSGFGLRPEPLAASVVADARPTLLVMLGVATLVLLVACANVANLSLARAAESEAELRTRAALGAGRARLVRQLLVESALVGALGALAGLLLAGAGLELMRAFEPGRLPRVDEATFDLRVLAYATVAALVASLLFGGLSAVQATRAVLSRPLQDTLRAGVPPRPRLRRALLVSQVSLSLVLASGAGLLVRSFSRLVAVDPGFEPRGVLTARVSLPDVRYGYREKGPQIADFYRRLDERLRSLPGVQAVGATTSPPLSGAGVRSRKFAWRGAEGETEWGATAADYTTVTPGWFEAAGVRLLAGRFLTERDDRAHPVAVVVDASLAARAWPGPASSAVGQPIRVEVFRDGAFLPVWGEVAGVIASVRLDRLEAVRQGQLYLAHAQSPQRTMHPTLRVTGDPTALVPAVQAAVDALESRLPVFDVRLAAEHVETATALARFAFLTLTAFAAVAVLLAAAGVYAVMSHAVASRRFEIGVRLALGASPRRIQRLVLREGLALAALGVAIGLAGAVGLAGLLSQLLYGVGPRDPVTLASASALLAATALLACWAPARRAGSLEPTEALRS